MKKTRKANNTKIKEFRNRVHETVTAIYDALNVEPITNGFAKTKKPTLYSKCGLWLLRNGYISNLGSHTKPSYIWGGIQPPSDDLCNKVAQGVYEKAKAKNSNNMKTKPIELPAPDAMPQVAFSLVNFTDQQLWDELKKRDYSIMDNKLYKVTYLA